LYGHSAQGKIAAMHEEVKVVDDTCIEMKNPYKVCCGRLRLGRWVGEYRFPRNMTANQLASQEEAEKKKKNGDDNLDELHASKD
jgi:hypothetical protein